MQRESLTLYHFSLLAIVLEWRFWGDSVFVLAFWASLYTERRDLAREFSRQVCGEQRPPREQGKFSEF